MFVAFGPIASDGDSGWHELSKRINKQTVDEWQFVAAWGDASKRTNGIYGNVCSCSHSHSIPTILTIGHWPLATHGAPNQEKSQFVNANPSTNEWFNSVPVADIHNIQFSLLEFNYKLHASLEYFTRNLQSNANTQSVKHRRARVTWWWWMWSLIASNSSHLYSERDCNTFTWIHAM